MIAGKAESSYGTIRHTPGRRINSRTYHQERSHRGGEGANIISRDFLSVRSPRASPSCIARDNVIFIFNLNHCFSRGFAVALMILISRFRNVTHFSGDSQDKRLDRVDFEIRFGKIPVSCKRSVRFTLLVRNIDKRNTEFDHGLTLAEVDFAVRLKLELRLGPNRRCLRDKKACYSRRRQRRGIREGSSRRVWKQYGNRDASRLSQATQRLSKPWDNRPKTLPSFSPRFTARLLPSSPRPSKARPDEGRDATDALLLDCATQEEGLPHHLDRAFSNSRSRGIKVRAREYLEYRRL